MIVHEDTKLQVTIAESPGGIPEPQIAVRMPKGTSYRLELGDGTRAEADAGLAILRDVVVRELSR